MNYLKAVLRKDSETKIAELKKLIILGEKLNKDTTPDKKKLEILLQREKKSTVKPVSKKTIKKTTTKTSNIKYAVKSVYTKNNSIIIDFNVDITKNDIKFFELKPNPFYRDVFDINGYFKEALSTKLSIDGINKITIGQFKPNVLRVVLSDKKNLKTNYLIKKRQIIINIDNLKTIKKKTIIVPKEVKKQIQKETNPYIDTKNSIRSITSKENKIIVKFNKSFNKKDIKFKAYKFNKNYEKVFDIKGKFKYTNPTKLKLGNVDRVIVTDVKNNNVRIKIRNKKDIKVKYTISSKELTISVDSSKKSLLPYPNFKSKTIVIDAGHGAHDVGAVGPNKRYEKVVTLKVAKYLYSILKKRGHKVYLTRTKDKFIKVMNRTILANKKKADIFVSIHANSVPKSKASKIQGIETFFLSPARSERAKRVAAKENKSDIRNMSSSSKSAFLESLNRPRITASHKLAIDVQAGILQSVKTKYKGVKDSGVREGPFWVLVGAQMPSILIELGYISHPTESKRLYSKKYQELLANGIANGVDSYFSKNP